ncbi:MAG: ClpXP protease specificity-enhancing factor SspB [Mariprofundales bacterium]|nr:ClpXP protease specificity-enhancing factor SspB [Mariprofundales bacterium]
MEMTQLAAARRAKELRDYFDSSGRIHIVVDATRDDVQVPPHLKGDHALCLLLNVRMPQIIEINRDGVKSTLSFSGNPFDCFIPIDAIWAAYQPNMSLDQGIIWLEQIPLALQQAVASMIEPADDKSDGTPTESDTPPPPDQEGSSGRRKGHLRIV